MKHRTWFRHVLKAIGVLLIGFSAPDLIYSICNYSAWEYYRSGWAQGATPMPNWMSFALQIIGPAVQLIFGIFLITGSQWLTGKLLPVGENYCDQCSYDLSGISAARCPECGVKLNDTDGGESDSVDDKSIEAH